MTKRETRTSGLAPCGAGVRLRAVVAVPVRNEAERIGACLDALEGQRGIEPGSCGVVLFLNNCTDDTASILAGRVSRVPLRLVCRDDPDAHAGWARREAMEAAAAWLEEESGSGTGLLLTTDADSRVPPDWVAKNLAAVLAGADAVAGRIALEPEEAGRLPDRLHARGRLEGTYDALLAEMAALLDPVPHDPWPNHGCVSGASLAVRLPAYRAVGGMPAIPVGEDRAFVEALTLADRRVRHAPEIVVVTSGRLNGRAPGGAADTMRLRCEEPDSVCDAALEPCRVAFRRHVWRSRLRALHGAGLVGDTARWARPLGIGPQAAARIAALPTIGGILAEAEAASPRLRRLPLRPRDLRAEIAMARLALRAVKATRRFAGIGHRVGRWAFGTRPGVAAGGPGPAIADLASGSDVVGQHGTV